MHLDVHREALQGWLVFAGAVVVAIITIWLVSDRGELEQRIATLEGAVPVGGKRLSEHVADQRRANADLRTTIDVLKDQVGFSLEKAFPDQQIFQSNPGFFFQTERDKAIDTLFKRAQEKGIADYDRYIGFGTAERVPPPSAPPSREDAPNLLRVLQLTEKAVKICLETPTPLQKLIVEPHGNAIRSTVVTPAGRPPLLREYELKLKIRGTLKDILWILHRLSPGRDSSQEKSGQEYPLVLKHLRLSSDNRAPGQTIQQLDLEMTLAGMEFIAEDNRAGAAAGTQRPGLG
nr:hypothetical protein [Planctomycetota bacterium]